MVARTDAALTPAARSAWRWRIVYLRALIDKGLYERKGKLEGGTLKMKMILLNALSVLMAGSAMGAQQWALFETSFTSSIKHENPFLDVQVDVVFHQGDQQWLVPAFWAGGDKWTVRFAPPVLGNYTYQVQCSDPANRSLNGKERTLHVTAYTGNNPLLKHGFLRVAKDKRHFEHADGTPFFWLGDTWWKCLCKRMTWEGFQELTADRKAKGIIREKLLNDAGGCVSISARSGASREYVT